MTAKRPTAAQARALRIAAADIAGHIRTAARTARVLIREGWAAEEGDRLVITNDGRRAVGAAVPVVCEACEDAGTGCYYCAPAETTEETPTVENAAQLGATVEVVEGFAANMTGTVEAVEESATLGRRFLVALPCYGPRWLNESFVRPAAA
ncbi:hypothetical protein [Micromonospora sp. NPDC047730]|uniref:hypothetical protein n=1 Tax=Micromonospora sp. NPDC047730 TaxID=3364253 RepID=UPI0037139F0A